jgi:hypothetical protein
MSLSAKLFFDENSDSESLFLRITLSKEQIAEAKEKKDYLLALLKPELSNSTEVSVGHWLQGSYKNHTLIRPVKKGDEFDIDVGIYLLCNAEIDGLEAHVAKNLNREILEWYVSNRPEAKVAESKNSCERLSYPASFHLDIPLYYFDEKTGICKLATQNDGWVDSDPKALQDWFDIAVSHLEKSSIAKLRRIIKYLKVWTALKSKSDGVSIPSIALTVLVANNFIEFDDDDDTFIQTTINVMEYILNNDTLKNPVHGGDLFGFKDNDLQLAQSKAQALKKSCEFIAQSTDSFEQYVLWSATFEHMFPPFIERLEEVTKNTKLPAITTPPKINVRHLDKSKNLLNNKVTNSVRTFRDEELYFSIENTHDYSNNAEVRWIVRNQDDEARRLNDLGHTTVLSKDEVRNEGCSYNGTHYMECLVLDNNTIKGISAVKVIVTGFSRPLRNPPRKQHFKRK